MPSARYIKKKSELGRRMAKRRWELERQRIDAEMPARIAEMEMRRVLAENAIDPGDYIGTLQWRERSGKVRKWVVRRAERINQIEIDGVGGPKSWSWLTDRIRRHLT